MAAAMIIEPLPKSSVRRRGNIDANYEEYDYEKELFRYLGISEVYDEETEIFGRVSRRCVR